MPLKVAELARIVERDGWVLARTRGSHRQYVRPTKPGKVTIASKPSKVIRASESVGSVHARAASPELLSEPPSAPPMAGAPSGVLALRCRRSGGAAQARRALPRCGGVRAAARPDLRRQRRAERGRFGGDPDGSHELLIAAADLGLRPYGVTFHIGSQMLRTDAWGEAIDEVGGLARRLTAVGIRLEMIDIGGGFPARYSESVPPITAYSEQIRQALDHLSHCPRNRHRDSQDRGLGPTLEEGPRNFARLRRCTSTR